LKFSYAKFVQEFAYQKLLKSVDFLLRYSNVKLCTFLRDNVVALDEAGLPKTFETVFIKTTKIILRHSEMLLICKHSRTDPNQS